MAFRTLITNPQQIKIFESKHIELTFHSKNINEDFTPFTLDLSKLSEELKGLNHEYIVSLVGIKGEMRIDEDLCTVSELLASRCSYQGKLSLKGRRLKFSLYFHSRNSILKQAVSQNFHGKYKETNYETLIPIEELEDSNSIWEFELDEDVGPVIKINKKITNIDTLLKTEKIWQGLIIPITMKQGLKFLLENWEEDELSWKRTWKHWIEDYCGKGTLDSAPIDEDSTLQQKEDWTHNIVERFTSGENYIEFINLGINEGEDEE